MKPVNSLIEDALSNHNLLARALFERSESLSQFLPYEEYLPEFGLFRQKDGSLGCVYAVELCEHEAKTGAEITSLLESLKAWFRLSEEYSLSILFEQSRISTRDPIWQSLAQSSDLTRGDLPAELHLSRMERLRQSSDPANAPMKRRLFLSIRKFGTSAKKYRVKRAKKLAKELLNPHQTLANELEGFVKQLKTFNYQLAQIEMKSPLPLKKLDAEKLADVLRQTFNPVTYFQRPFAKLNPNLSLSDQLIYCDSKLDYAGIEREGVRTRTLSLKNAPNFAYPGAMAYFLSLNFPFRICLNLSFPSVSSVKGHFAVKSFFLQNTPTADSRRQKEEIVALQDKLIRGDQVIQMSFSVLLEAPSSEELEIHTQECLARFQTHMDCETILENEIGLGLWLNALPLNYHPIVDLTSRRSIRILASDLVHFLPVFDTFRGSPIQKAQSLFLSRENGLVPFGLKSFGNSHMTAVLGDTGSAKSAQVIQILLGEERRENKPLIFVIDNKTSYGMLSHFLNSELTTFEKGKPMPFSPFRGEFDEDKLKFLVQFLASAMQLTSPQFQVESEHRTCLTQALKLAYQTKERSLGVRYIEGNLIPNAKNPGERTELNLSLEDVIGALGTLTGDPEFESYGKFVDEIAIKLRPFYGDGIYASFFKNTAVNQGTKAIQADLYVYDLDALTGDSILQALVTMSVIDEIRRKIAAHDGKQRGGFLVLEELGMLGRSNPTAKDFVVEAAETFRKLGFFLIGLTPDPLNYFKTAAGQAMWNVADHYLFLATKEDNVDLIAKNSNLLNEAAVQIVKSLRTVPGKYADCFYIHKNKTVSGAFRIVPSAQEMWLVPTQRQDAIEAQKALKRFPKEPRKALEELVSQFPHGTTEPPIFSEGNKGPSAKGGLS